VKKQALILYLSGSPQEFRSIKNNNHYYREGIAMEKTLLFDPITGKRMDRSNLSSPFLYLTLWLWVVLVWGGMLALSPVAQVEAAEKVGPPYDFNTAIIWMEGEDADQ